MKASLALPSPKKAKEDLISRTLGAYYQRSHSHLFSGPDIAQGGGGLIFTCTGCPRSGGDLLWVSSAYLCTLDKSRALVPTPMERPIQQHRIINGVSKTPGQF